MEATPTTRRKSVEAAGRCCERRCARQAAMTVTLALFVYTQPLPRSTAVPTSVDEAAAAASRGQGALIHADSVAPAPIAKAGRVARGGAARKRKGALNELVCGPAMPRQPKIRCTLAGPRHEARRPTRSRWAHRNAQASVLNTDTCRVMDAHLSEHGTTRSS